MIVISDTSPLNYLVLLAIQELLPRLFGEVYTPPSVVQELSAPETPEQVRRWIAAPPDWLLIKAPSRPVVQTRLGRGESDAIALAKELQADLLLIDELAGREAAQREGLTPRGTLAVIATAAAEGLLDLNATLARLERTNFRMSPEVLKQIRKDRPG